jgi:mycoredoxin
MTKSEMTNKIIVYGHSTCPGVGPVKGLLRRAGVPFEYVDIHRNRAAATDVLAINNGDESVPTLVFPDGTTLTEPTVGALKEKLEAMGYRVGLVAWLLGNSWRIFVAVVILIGVLRFLGVF